VNINEIENDNISYDTLDESILDTIVIILYKNRKEIFLE
jgi:hypothetical protein